MSIRIEGGAPLLQVFDMPASVAFYRDMLGFEIVSAAPPGPDADWVLLRHGGGSVEVMLNTAYEAAHRPPAREPARIAWHRDTALYFGCPDLDGAHTHLRSRGLDVAAPAVTPYGFRALHLRDPDGYGITLHWPKDA